jgi:type I restriction enzyme R subunit
MPPDKLTSANFGFLVAHDRLLEHLGGLAERYFADDPSTCLIKLRQFGEVLAQCTAACVGLYTYATRISRTPAASDGRARIE